MVGETIVLRVAEANSTDPGMSRVRLDEDSRITLGAEIGDVVEIEKTKKTVGRVFRARPEDENKGIVRIDAVMRNNCGVSIGDKVKVRRVKVEEAKKITLAPIIRKDQRLKFGEGIDEFVQKALIRRPMLEQDNISVPGLTLAGHSGLLFKVVKTIPTKVPVEAARIVTEWISSCSVRAKGILPMNARLNSERMFTGIFTRKRLLWLTQSDFMDCIGTSIL